MTLQEHFLQNEVPALLDDLQADTAPIWGVMTAQHMVEHLSALLYISLGKKEFPLMIPQENLEKSRAWLMSDKEFRPGTVAPGLPQTPGKLRFATLAEAKTKLLETIQAFSDHYQANPTAEVMHPVFGMINKTQWEQFHFKHIQHHLMQFGLIPLSEYKRRKLEN